jgi:DNA-directed RNA polymerase subunit K/omega
MSDDLDDISVDGVDNDYDSSVADEPDAVVGGDQSSDEDNETDSIDDDSSVLMYAPEVKVPKKETEATNFLDTSNAIRTALIVHPDKRVTDNKLHRTELARVVAVRAKQISEGAETYVDCSGMTDPIKRAYKELFARMNPLKIRRFIGSTDESTNIYEEWKVREMAFPDLTYDWH